MPLKPTPISGEGVEERFVNLGAVTFSNGVLKKCRVGINQYAQSEWWWNNIRQ